MNFVGSNMEVPALLDRLNINGQAVVILSCFVLFFFTYVVI